jgi:hypothetical protein
MGVKCPLFYIMEKFKHEEQFLKNLTEKTKEMFSIMGLTDGHNLSPSELSIPVHQFKTPLTV